METMREPDRTTEPTIKVACRRCDGAGDIHNPHYYPDNADGEPERYECANCYGTGHERLMVYLNVYLVTRHCGGPEEGGWYYDAGEPIESLRVNPFCDQVTADRLIELAEERWRDLASPRSRFNVGGGPDVLARFENDFAAEWPDERPRYE